MPFALCRILPYAESSSGWQRGCCSFPGYPWSKGQPCQQMGTLEHARVPSQLKMPLGPEMSLKLMCSVVQIQTRSSFPVCRGRALFILPVAVAWQASLQSCCSRGPIQTCRHRSLSPTMPAVLPCSRPSTWPSLTTTRMWSLSSLSKKVRILSLFYVHIFQLSKMYPTHFSLRGCIAANALHATNNLQIIPDFSLKDSMDQTVLGLALWTGNPPTLHPQQAALRGHLAVCCVSNTCIMFVRYAHHSGSAAGLRGIY